MVAAAAPWFVAIGIATEGRFFEQAVGGDMLSKIGSGEEKHWGPPGFYLLTFGVAAFPGAWIVLCALPTAWRDRLNPPTRFLLAWIVPSWLVFEAVSTKLPHYTLPMYPALMLLGAAWAMDPLRRLPARWWRWSALAALRARGARPGPGGGGGRLVPAAGALRAALLVLPLAAAAGLGGGAQRRARRLGPRRDARRAARRAALCRGAGGRGAAARAAAGSRRGWRRCCRTGRRACRPAISASPAIPSPRCCSPWAGTSLLRTGTDAARFLAGGPGRVVAVGDRAERDFQREVAALALPLQEIGQVTGFNYTRGRWVTLMLYRRRNRNAMIGAT